MLENWQCKNFASLETIELFNILYLRQQIFILEQQCLYADIEALDISAWHLMGYTDNKLCAYLRILAPGSTRPEPSIGRVLIVKNRRRCGLGKKLMHEGIRRTNSMFPDKPIRISAQAMLQGYYAGFGFKPAGNIFLMDDIEHIDMVLAYQGRI